MSEPLAEPEEATPQFLPADGAHTRRCDLLVLASSFAALLFLVPRRAFVSMWVEGVPEYADVLLAILGRSDRVFPCWFSFGGVTLPLAMSAYVGPAFYYAHLPAVWLHVAGIVSDPFSYRLTGIVLFVVDAWLFYALLRVAVPVAFAATGALLFLSTPTLFLLSLTEYQSLFVILLFVFTSLWFGARFNKAGRARDLLIGAFCFGALLLTRFEIIVWLGAAVIAWIGLNRGRPLIAPFFSLPHRGVTLAGAAAAFAAGALPLIAFNLRCAQDNLLMFIRDRVIPTSLTGSGASPIDNLATRMSTFWHYVVLQAWPRYELTVQNWVIAILFACSVVIAVRTVWRTRHISFPLVIILTTIPLSIFVKAYLREEHLAVLIPAVIAMLVTTLAGQSADLSRHGATAIAVLLVSSNVAVSALDWNHWVTLPRTSETMINSADPVLLAKALDDRFRNARILFTNIGMSEGVRLVTRGRARGEDIMDWTGPEGFRDRVRAAILDTGVRRVFVAANLDRDGSAGTFPRTAALLEILNQQGVRYRIDTLSSPRNEDLYDLIVLEPGAGTSNLERVSPSMTLSSVRDIRPDTGPDGSARFIGSVIGTGFVSGDAVRINGRMVETTFGNSEWITFSAPAEVLSRGRDHSAEVVRPSTLERTPATSFTYVAP